MTIVEITGGMLRSCAQPHRPFTASLSERGRHLIAVCIAYPGAMLWSPAYLETRLPRPLLTKDSGTLYAVNDVGAYVLSLLHSRSEHLYWQRAHQLLHDQADGSLSVASQ